MNREHMETKKIIVHTNQKRRKRIERIKQMILLLFFAATLLPILSSSILLHRVSKLEQEVVQMLGSDRDMKTLISSGEALMSNPNVDVDQLTGEDGSQPETEPAEDAQVQDETTVQQKRVYLTFDDGPSIYTGQILDILKANDIKATFFVIAREDESYWPYYTRILEEGHTLGMHSYTHDYNQVYASLDSFETDVNSLSQFLYDRTGEYPTIYRFPGGSSNTVSNVPMEECIAYLNEQGITYYDWNALNGDAVSSELPPEKLVENIMNSVRQNNTSIVLMHDMQSRHTTVESLQPLIDTLKDEGYEILPIDENTPLIQHIPYDTDFQDAAD
mgnify:FL=1